MEPFPRRTGNLILKGGRWQFPESLDRALADISAELCRRSFVKNFSWARWLRFRGYPAACLVNLAFPSTGGSFISDMCFASTRNLSTLPFNFSKRKNTNGNFYLDFTNAVNTFFNPFMLIFLSRPNFLAKSLAIFREKLQKRSVKKCVLFSKNKLSSTNKFVWEKRKSKRRIMIKVESWKFRMEKRRVEQRKRERGFSVLCI